VIRGDLTCPDCGASLIYTAGSGARQYPHYECERREETGCAGNVTAHKKTGEPMGIPADRETRRARALAHRAFDWIWQRGGMTRKQAYKWLAEAMGVNGMECHIGEMNKEEADRVVTLIERYQLERYGSPDKTGVRRA
jgi:hypothetical protein